MSSTKKSTTVLGPSAIQDEFQAADLPDKRLNRRLGAMAQSIGQEPGQSFPRLARSDSELEAFYRLFNNPRVTHEAILEPHIRATCERACTCDEVLALHDTTQFEFKRPDPDAAGLGYLNANRRGFLGHFSMLSDSASGATLGISGMELLFREKATKPSSVKSRKMSGHDCAKQADRESLRWPRMVEQVEARLDGRIPVVHVMDREGDSFTLLHDLMRKEHRFVIRLSKERKASCTDEADGGWEPLSQVLARLDGSTEREVPLSRRKTRSAPRSNKTHPARKGRIARLRFTAGSVQFCRPKYLKAPYPKSLQVNVVRVYEIDTPDGEEPVEWRLVTTDPIETESNVIAVVDKYRARWAIEEFFKALKTGCAYKDRGAENRRSLLNVLALLVPIAWQILSVRDLARSNPTQPATLVMSERQLAVLRAISKTPVPDNPTIEEAMYSIAAQGGHLKRNGPPGWQTLVKGLELLLSAEIGWAAAMEVKEKA